jgi:enoyl-CoA hydratase/carnithine racemase
LIETIRESDYAASRDITADAIAAQRTTPEGQEGLRAFLERRKTGWTQ